MTIDPTVRRDGLRLEAGSASRTHRHVAPRQQGKKIVLERTSVDLDESLLRKSGGILPDELGSRP
jgi:hypothetical protein